MKSGPPLLEARDLGKTYRLYDSPWHRLVERLTGRRKHREHVALEGVTFEMRRGDGLGIIGPNGAGKSTLLSLLAGVLKPTVGEVHVRGTVSSILELGAGFHPDFTGAQSIRINAAMLGLSEAAVEEKTPAIVDFCELGDFLHEPVKVYSTGMSMRLAFAIATQVEPDVLIIDEALSVGDGYFQKKCTDRILQLMAGGTALLFCSHAMYFVERFCQKALWLQGGRIAAAGEAHAVIDAYERDLDRRRGATRAGDGVAGARDEVATKPADGLQPAALTAVELLHASPRDGDKPAVYEPEQRWGVELRWRAESEQLQFQVGVGVDRGDGVQTLSFSSRNTGLEPMTGHRHYRCRLELESLPINFGVFDLYVFLLDEEGVHVYDRRVVDAAFEVKPTDYRIGLIRAHPRIEWSGVAVDAPEEAFARE